MKLTKRKTIEAATVRIKVAGIGLGGQGVLVPGNIILTASHCIKISGGLYLSLAAGYAPMQITCGQRELQVTPIAADHVGDAAALGALDNQEFYHAVEAFEEFCENTKPVRISRRKRKPLTPFPICIYTHEREWISGCAQVGDLSHQIAIKMDSKIKGGTSGSGIYDAHGELVGIVSHSTESPPYSGMAPRPLLALPVWIVEQISQ